MGTTIHAYSNVDAQRRRTDFVTDEYRRNKYDLNQPHQDFGPEFGRPEDKSKDRRLKHHRERDFDYDKAKR